MPITVPSRPSKGAAEAMVASADRYFSSRCATARPAPSMAARRSVSLHWGLLLRVRRPLASTSPSAEFCASWLTTSGVGTDLDDTVMASSSSLGGATRAVLRATKRSKISAIPRTEHAIRGQIGQPAACMMDSKSLSAQMEAIGDYGPASGCHFVTNRYVAVRPMRGAAHPQKLWITLWATHVNNLTKWRHAVLATD
ncbi:hypothetical protein D3C71_1645790 [compost metagenome]